MSNITFRPTTDDDLPLLERIYASTRAEELKLTDWSDEQKAAFCKQQFEAQHKYYHDMFADAHYNLILEAGQPIGRLYLDHREEEHRVIDIALLPAHRGRGIGRKLMQDVLDEAAAVGKRVRIHVEQNNPAMHLYNRLGFQKIEEQSVYWLMEWVPPRSAE
jgi:ribosomal protein S18 acetylase RimI-like enzyme